MANVSVPQNGNSSSAQSSSFSSAQEQVTAWNQEAESLHNRLLKGLNSDIFHKFETEEITQRLRPQIDEFVQKNISSQFKEDADKMAEQLFDELIGLGPISSLMENPTISEVMVNGPNEIYIEKGGKLTLTPKKFRSEKHLRFIIDQIVGQVGRHISEKSPMVDARLKNGSRVNVIIPPATLGGSKITIRRFSHNLFSPDALIENGTLSEDMFTFIKSAVSGATNIIISGRTGSGKTTLLNMFSNFVPNDERIVTIEDAAELSLQLDHVVTLESVQPDRDGNNGVTMRDLMINALRMRPDRIIMGECRGKEALDMLQAMNTGHDGSMSTLHANSPRDALARMSTMIMMAGFELPEAVIRHQVSSAIDLIVQIDRLPDGSRKVTKITEITGMEGDVIQLQDIYELEWKVDEKGKGVGRHVCMGIRPFCSTKLQALNLPLPSFVESSTASQSTILVENKDKFQGDDNSFLKVR
jgi:pilus assembly protein CpaF